MSYNIIERYRVAMRQMGRDAGDDLSDETLEERLGDVAQGAGITLEQLVRTIEARVGRNLDYSREFIEGHTHEFSAYEPTRGSIIVCKYCGTFKDHPIHEVK